MIVVTDTKDLFKEIKSELNQIKEKEADKILGYMMGSLLAGNPTEDGHAHEAWLTAIEQLPDTFSRTKAVASYNEQKRSGDTTASQYGSSRVETDDTSITVTVSNSLPFVRKLEYGLQIKVGDASGNKGKKIDPVKRPPEKGPLYGSRESGRGGIMVFERGGKIIKTKVYRPTGAETGFIKKAIDKTVQFVKSLGYIVRKRNIK